MKQFKLESKRVFYCSKLQSFGEFVTSYLLSLTKKYLVPAKLSPSSTMTSRLNGRITMWVPQTSMAAQRPSGSTLTSGIQQLVKNPPCEKHHNTSSLANDDTSLQKNTAFSFFHFPLTQYKYQCNLINHFSNKTVIPSLMALQRNAVMLFVSHAFQDHIPLQTTIQTKTTDCMR